MQQRATFTSPTTHDSSILEGMRQDALYLTVLVLGAMGFVLISGAGLGWSAFRGAAMGGLLLTTALAAYAVANRSYLTAGWLAIAGSTVTILLALYWYPSYNIAALLVIPAGMATLLVSAWGGILLVLAATVMILHSGELFILPSDDAPLATLIVIWGSTGLVWLSLQTTREAISWTWGNYERANRLLEDAREQRLILKETEEDLVQANRQLAALYGRLRGMHQVAEEARQMKEEFVANVSHELRTPLNMIIGFSEMITKSPHVYGPNLPPALLADVAAIQRNSQHLASLVDDVLDLSQVEAGRMALSKEWVDLQGIIEAAALAVRTLYDTKGLYLDIAVTLSPALIDCDPTRIRQVVLNLLSNAGRFTKEGGVTVRARSEEGKIIVSVKDSGPGIAPEDQQRLFEPFQQLDSSIRRQHGGSGLGLSISRRFVEMHGGKMWFESMSGVGTTFYFSLPLTLIPSEEPVQPSRHLRTNSPSQRYIERTRRSQSDPRPIYPRFVLLNAAESVQRLFRRYMDDATVVCADSVEQAIAEMQRLPVKALIANISLPTDTEPVTPLSQLPYDTPAILCWIPSVDEAAQRLGVVKYLIKPVTCETLLATLDSMDKDVTDVLLVDDDTEALQLFARMLAAAPRRYRVLRATDGQQALSLLRQRQPDVMLLDLTMPGTDGFEVLRQKSQDPAIKDIPVVVISAQDPLGEPIVSNGLTVTRGSGLSMRNVVDCINSFTEILQPSGPPAAPEQTERLLA